MSRCSAAGRYRAASVTPSISGSEGGRRRSGDGGDATPFLVQPCRIKRHRSGRGDPFGEGDVLLVETGAVTADEN